MKTSERRAGNRIGKQRCSLRNGTGKQRRGNSERRNRERRRRIPAEWKKRLTRNDYAIREQTGFTNSEIRTGNPRTDGRTEATEENGTDTHMYRLPEETKPQIERYVDVLYVYLCMYMQKERGDGETEWERGKEGERYGPVANSRLGPGPMQDLPFPQSATRSIHPGNQTQDQCSVRPRQIRRRVYTGQGAPGQSE